MDNDKIDELLEELNGVCISYEWNIYVDGQNSMNNIKYVVTA